jgi:hypothetical protein
VRRGAARLRGRAGSRAPPKEKKDAGGSTPPFNAQAPSLAPAAARALNVLLHAP